MRYSRVDGSFHYCTLEAKEARADTALHRSLGKPQKRCYVGVAVASEIRKAYRLLFLL